MVLRVIVNSGTRLGGLTIEIGVDDEYENWWSTVTRLFGVLEIAMRYWEPEVEEPLSIDQREPIGATLGGTTSRAKGQR